MKRAIVIALTLFRSMLITILVSAQSGGSLDLRTNVIAGGGNTSGGGSQQASVTIGQPTTGSSSGGSIQIQGGFWQSIRGVVSSN